jgi:hypothetical protein
MRDLPNIGHAHLGEHLDRELMFTFFAAFSRFEYALKTAGLRQPNDKAAEPDWQTFAKKIAEPLRERMATDGVLRAAVEDLVKEPPRKQRGDRLGGYGPSRRRLRCSKPAPPRPARSQQSIPRGEGAAPRCRRRA